MTMWRIKVLLLCCYLILVSNGEQSETKISTACYGAPGLTCTGHTPRCTEPLFISITNITFGYRRGCSGLGVSNCGDTSCCREETSDCFTPYNPTLLSQLQQTCNGRPTCTLNRKNGLNEQSGHCRSGTGFHSFSKIEYKCTDKAFSPISGIGKKPPLPPGSGDSQADTDVEGSNVGAIVGGIVGVISVLAIVGAVILFYIRRDKKDASSTKAGYFSRNVPNERHQADSALPKNITPHHNIDVKNPTCSPRTNPPSGDDYDYIPGDNHVGQKSVTSDINLKHTGEDNYHHIGGNQSNTVTDDAYNHIGEHEMTGLDSGGYHHIGGNLGRQEITDGTYNHIGGSHRHPVVADGTYNHIGDSHGHPAVADGTYNRIGDSLGHPAASDGTYNHIGDSHGHAIVTDGEYNHIGDSHRHPVVAGGTYNHIKGDHTVDKQEGGYSLAKNN